MREICQSQTEIAYPWLLQLDHARELQALSGLLDQNPMIAQFVHQDLCGERQSIAGAKGLSADQIFRAMLLKQMHRWSYDELHFHLADSQTFGTFCRLSLLAEPPARSTLASNIKRIKPETLEAINRLLVLDATKRKIERASTVRIDCTVVETNIHPPSDSSLLWDCVRVLSRLMREAQEAMPSATFHFPDRQRRAKRRNREISSTGSA